MTPQLTIDIVIFLIILGAATATISLIVATYYEKSKRLRKEAEAIRESAKEEIASLQQQLDFFKRTQIKSDQLPVAFPLESDGVEIRVSARYVVNHCAYADVLIKSFPIADDEGFARLEAEELLDHLNEK